MTIIHFSRRSIAGGLLLLAPALAMAQSRTGDRPAMDHVTETRLARSAAPPAVSAGARIWFWTGSKYVIGDSGTTAVNCYVGRPWVPSIEPHCFDAEGSATIMPIQMRRQELYARGMAEADVEKEIAAAIAAGRLRVPRVPAFTYMMSQSQELVSGNGSSVGAWQPHLMIYFPNLTNAGTGLPGFVPEVGFVENPGTPFSAVVLPMKAFVK
jgi:hypothetical protein